MPVIRISFLWIFFLLSSQITTAQGWSYVYIQGDKKNSFYVKIDEQMLPRYSKNYYIIPRLAPGPMRIEVLFQRNEYPPAFFNILIPENGYRGFLLVRKEGRFALYDLQQHFYLFPGDESVDRLPLAQTEKKEAIKTIPEKPEPVTDTSEIVYTQRKPSRDRDQPHFIHDLQLTNQHQITSPPIRSEPVFDSSVTSARTPTRETVRIPADLTPIPNSDCPEPINARNFDDFFQKVQDKEEGEKRMRYLMKNASENCFSTQQAYFLAKSLKAESMRYSFLKEIYSRITDQQNFYLLEDYLFNTREWKSYFRLIQR